MMPAPFTQHLRSLGERIQGSPQEEDMSFKTAFDFKDRNVLVIGASRGGIGSAVAAGFTECGASVRITGAEPEPIVADQGRYPYTQLDVADPDAVQRRDCAPRRGV